MVHYLDIGYHEKFNFIHTLMEKLIFHKYFLAFFFFSSFFFCRVGQITGLHPISDQSPTSRRRSPMGLNAKHAAIQRTERSRRAQAGVRETNPMGLQSCFHIIGVSEPDHAPVSAR